MKQRLEKFKKFLEKYERHISSGALIGGFIIDSLTLRRIDFFLENLIIISYLVIAGLSIALLNIYEGGRLRNKVFEWIRSLLPFVIQFAFGGLFSAFLIFYFRSSTIAAGWPFVLILAGLLVGNELFKKYYQRTAFHMSVYYFLLFLFFIFYIPILLGQMGKLIFLLSGAASLIAFALFMLALQYVIPKRIRETRKIIVMSVVSIFVFTNLLYFTNIIPPIPLSLKDKGVYHSLIKIPGGYDVEYEQVSKLNLFKRYQTVHVTPGRALYVFSSVFAPTKLNTNIVHHWQYYSESEGKWITSSRATYGIVGGRDAGYRGYSWKSNITPGYWRVNVETPQGQLIGRIKFLVEAAITPPQLEKKIL